MGAILVIREMNLNVPGGRLYCRHTEIDLSRPSLLFIHGLGESGLSFIEAFREPILDRFNILIPDLLGFGKSSDATDNDYTFPAQIERLCALLDVSGIRSVSLVGHSMGGDISTELCRLKPHRVAAFINVEGDLTPDDRFITDLALQAEMEGRFEAWLRDDLRRGKVHQWSIDWPSCVRYAASLEMCRTKAFLASAQQISQLNEAVTNGSVGVIGERYRQLTVRRVFCWGAESLHPATRKWLVEQSGLVHQRFDGASHWVMLDRREAFYHFASGFFCG